MLCQKLNLLILVLFIAGKTFAAINSDEQKLIEELTGKSQVAQVEKKSKTIPLSERHFFAGLDAFKNKNYILALKHYNTVIIKYSSSKDVKNAYLAKAKLYNEMGLQDQADLNTKLASKLDNKLNK